jgi:hypothetical protein
MMKGTVIGITAMLVACFAIDASATNKHCAGLQTQGRSTLTWFGLEVYEAELCANAPVSWPDFSGPLVLSIEYKRAIPSERIVEQTRKEWRKMKVDRDGIQRWIALLEEVIPDIDSGDRLSFSVDENGVASFIHNELDTRIDDDPGFNREFLGIWLSPDMSRPKMRSELLGVK